LRTSTREDKGQSKMSGAEPKAGGLIGRISAFEAAAKAATDPKEMGAKISETSDRKKYNFASGLQKDVIRTRAALRNCVAEGENEVTFKDLYEECDGRIANLNRVLQNLKRAKEIHFDVEIFLQGTNDRDVIRLNESFWGGQYQVDEENVFRPGREFKDVAEEERKGRSYIKDNLATMKVHECFVCGKEVSPRDRMTVRDHVYHIRCIKCVQCGSKPHNKSEFVTFDGEIACSSECIRQYDAAHLHQKRK